MAQLDPQRFLPEGNYPASSLTTIRDFRWTDTLAALADPSLDPLFWRAERLGAESAWWEHVPFAHWIVCATSPRVLVELGTHTGVSYSAFCHAVARAGIRTRCHAIDTWHGDPHAGLYGPEVLNELRAFHDERFAAFSTLLQCTFDDGLARIEDGSIDLLHIDGLHTYEAVRHDFESWLPKLSDRAVVLFHDINVRRDDFGVWRLWAELRDQYRAFDFLHGHGLGVLAVGEETPAPVAALCKLDDPAAIAMIRARFARLGEHWWIDTRERLLARSLSQHVAASDAQAEQWRTEVARSSSEAEGLRAELGQRTAEAEHPRAEAGRHAREADAARHAAERAWEDIRTASARLFHAEQEAVGLRVRAEQAETRALLAEADGSAEAARAAELESTLAEADAEQVRLRHELDDVLRSTFWQITGPARRAASVLPSGLRRQVRRGARVAYWVLTPHRTRERIAYFRTRREALRLSPHAVVDPPAVEEPASPSPVVDPPAVEEPASPSPEAGVRSAIQPKPNPEDAAAPSWVYVSGEPDTPGHQYRVMRPAAAARTVGIRTSWMRPEQIPERIGEIEAADALIIWRAAWDERIAAAVDGARRGGAKIVFDIDDLMVVPELACTEVIDGIRTQYLTEEAVSDYYSRVRATMAVADLCLATTEELAQDMRRMQMPTAVFPNGVDHATITTSRIAARRHAAQPNDGLVRIGYAGGSRTHQRDFAACAAAVATVLRARPETRLVAFCRADGTLPCLDVDEFVELRGLEDRVEWRNFVPLECLPEEISRFDINLAPLEIGNPFCEAKSELKFFEAALVDVPTIASPTGPFRRSIREGETGFLASTRVDWERALFRLVDDVSLRRRIARSARREALWRFGPERRAELTRVLLDLLRGGERTARAFAEEIRLANVHPPTPCIPDNEIVFAADQLGVAEVSVVVPLYNYAHYLEEALESVRVQTLAALDLIVVDDQSTDNSLQVALDWLKSHAGRFNRVLLIRNTANSGLAFTRNVGFDWADTPWVLPLDADNRLLPECAAECLRVARQSRAAYLYPTIRQFGSASDLMGVTDYDPVRLANGNYIDAMALISRAAWICVGGYAHVNGAWEDFDFWCRLAERGFWGERVPGAPLAEYRFHSTSMAQSAAVQSDVMRRVIQQVSAEHPWLRITWSYSKPEAAPPADRQSVASPEKATASDSERKPSRAELLLESIPAAGKILEVGPSFSPVAPKSAGWNTKTLDHTTRESLVTKYKGHQGVDVDRIEEVDFVWTSGPLCDAVPTEEWGSFDGLIASHVIEHTPDFVSFLNSMEVLLKNSGVAALAIPDKRYCFDYFRPLSTTGQVLAAHLDGRSRHSVERAFDYAAYSTVNGQAISWGQHPAKELRLVNSLEMARGFASNISNGSDYVDIHAWCFVPASFELILLELAILGEIDLRVERITPADGCEFLCWLRRGGKAAVAVMSATQRADARLALLKRAMLEARSQVDWLLAGEPDLRTSGIMQQAVAGVLRSKSAITASPKLSRQEASTPASAPPMLHTAVDAHGTRVPQEPLTRSGEHYEPVGKVSADHSRLTYMLPLLRCPETELPLLLCSEGDALVSEDGSRRWPLMMGRPLLFPGLHTPKVNPDTHLSNPLPARALAMIHSTSNPILHLSAGGTIERFDHVIEAEAAVFRNTDLICDVHHLPFKAGAFEAVLALNAFEHYREPHAAAREIWRVLRPGGRVLIHTAFLQPLHEAPGHFYNCTRYGLEAWFEGFDIEELNVSENFHPGYSLSWLASECESALRSRGSEADADRFLAAPLRRLVSLWRNPESARIDEPVWSSLAALPQEMQQGIAAGFELVARRPSA
jgi:O-antigen biosynthesis protein